MTVVDPASFEPASLLEIDDPYPVFAALRDAAPVLPLTNGFVAVTGYEAADAVFRDHHFTSGLIAERYRQALPPGAARDELSHRINFLDPPDHPRVRGLVSRAFTPGRVRDLRPWVEGEAQRLLDELDARGRDGTPVDIRHGFAHLLPSFVISELLGVPLADRDRLTSWTEDVTPLLGVQVAPAAKARALEASEQFAAYASALLDERRREPGDDLLTAFVAVEDGHERLSREELLSLVVTLYSAGHRTTRDLFTNGLLTLLQHPDQYAAVAAEPSLAAGAVNEMLRFQTPTLYVARVAGEGASILGTDVPLWSPILLFLAAANRDPARFHDPDTFDIARDEGAPLSFAFGAHHCLGASLARMEAEVMLVAVTQRWPQLTVADPPPAWWSSGPFRGVDHLFVDLTC